jgi:hypothetical protein
MFEASPVILARGCRAKNPDLSRLTVSMRDGTLHVYINRAREREIGQPTRRRKTKLTESTNPDWKDLRREQEAPPSR